MKKVKIVLLVVFSLFGGTLHAQTDFKYDNVVYKTIYPKDLCQFLKTNPQAILIDVRTPGEYADTSGYGNLNIGHLKNAINIQIDSLSKAIPELKKNGDKPIVLYCSHSQRSRRGSKLLIENGFNQVLNLNGGMSWMNQANEVDFPCKKDFIVSSLPYKSVSAEEAIELVRRNHDMLIVDVRTAAQFASRDTLEENNIGRIKGAVNIPAKQFKICLSKIEGYKNKIVLVYDDGGVESNPAAKYLTEKGYTQVYNLLGGLSAVIGKDKETMNTRAELLEGGPSYNLLNVREALNLLEKSPEVAVLDIRPSDEYNNKSNSKWRNLGYIKNAIHIEPTEFKNKVKELQKFNNVPLLVYGAKNSATYCKMLKENGFKNVNLLCGGIWDMVSAGANINSMTDVKPFLVDHEGLY